MHLEGVGCEDVGWIELAYERVRVTSCRPDLEEEEVCQGRIAKRW